MLPAQKGPFDVLRVEFLRAVRTVCCRCTLCVASSLEFRYLFAVLLCCALLLTAVTWSCVVDGFLDVMCVYVIRMTFSLSLCTSVTCQL